MAFVAPQHIRVGASSARIDMIALQISTPCFITFLQTLSSCAGVLNCLKRSEQRCRLSRSGRLLRRQGPGRKYLPSRHRRAQRTNISESGQASSLTRLDDPCRCRRDVGYLRIHVVSEHTALPRTTSSLVDRCRPRAGPGGMGTRAASSGGPKAVRQDRRSTRRDSRWTTGSRLWPEPMNL